MTEKTVHSKWGASSSHRWMKCPGSIRLSEGQPNNSSIHAREGTAAHAVAEKCLVNNWDADRMFGETIAVENDSFVVGEEMVEGVQLYLDTVREIVGSDGILSVETEFELSSIMKGMFGTNDACVYLPKKKKLIVIDFKYGAGVSVEAIDNPQLKYYGLGAALKPYKDKGILPIDEVELMIVQPRAHHPAGPVRSHLIDAFELLEWSADLQEAAEATLDIDAPLKAGDHCQFCPASGICPELRKIATEDCEKHFGNSPADLTHEELAEFMEKADLVKEWLRAVRAHVFNTLNSGGQVPGWKIVQKRGRRQWTNAMDAALVLNEIGLDDGEIYEQSLVSPAQAEKLLPPGKRGSKKEAKEKIATVTESVSSGITIARESDGRDAVSGLDGSEFESDSE